MNNKIESPILKSAIESFVHGLEHFIQNTPKDYGFAILHVDQAVELILKEKLVLKGESIYKGNKESLNLHETFKNLERKNIKIPEKPRIEEIHEIRNMVQHRGHTPDENTTEYYIKIEYDFIKKFLTDEMNIEIDEILSPEIKDIFEEEGLSPLERLKKYKPSSLEEQISLINKQIDKEPASAIFSVFRLLESTVSRDFSNESLNSIISKLRAKKLISEIEYRELKKAYKLRNEITHTLYDPSIEETKKAVEIVFNVIKKISPQFFHEPDKIDTGINLEHFPEMIEDYLRELEIEDYAENTVRTYKSILNNFYIFLGDQKDLHNERRVLRAFKKYIQHKSDKNVSQDYIYLITTVVKKFFEFSGIGALNEVKTPKRTKSLPKSLNEEEIRNLINAPDNLNKGSKIVKLRDKAILSLLCSSGLRVSELVNLHKDDLDLRERTIVIREKGKEERILLFDEETKVLIEKYLIKRQDTSEFLFINRFEDPLTPRYIQIKIKEYAKVAGIKKDVNPKILRHSFVTHLLKKGVDIRIIQQLLGQEYLSTTEIYTNVDKQTLKDVYDKAKLL